MYVYNRLNQKLLEMGLSKSELARKIGISSRTIAKMNRGEAVSNNVIKKIASFLSCSPADIFEVTSDNHILQILREEKSAKISGGLYHELQVRMTYNSNHIEGSKLTEDQTRMIFETNTLDVGDSVLVDDVLETVHHFRAIDYIIDVAEEPLTEDIAKHIHYILKHDTKDSTLSWFAVGDYKKHANVVGGIETTRPSNVPMEMKKLIMEYGQKSEVSFKDIVAFHYGFERIHPFQDGNGRVGRLIVLKECLRYNIVPFIIEDAKKSFYYRGLSQWKEEPGYLIETCLDGQDTFKRLLDMFEIPYN